MAEVISDIDTGGAGTYATVALWWAGIAGDQSGNTPVAECRSSDSSADTSQISLDTTVTNYTQVILRPKSGTEHPGYYSTSSYHQEWTPTGTGQTAVNILIPNVLIQRLQFKLDASTYANNSIVCAATGQYIEQNIIQIVGNGVGILSYLNTTDITYYYNNVVYGDGTTGSRGISITYKTSYVYNNTVVNFDVCYYAGYLAAIAINNIAQNGVTYNYQNTSYFISPSSNNLSDTTDAPGTSPINSATLTFLDKTNHKYALVSTDTAAIDAGADLSATFTVDCINTLRPQNSVFDIGAFEYVSASTGTIIIQLAGGGGLAGPSGLAGPGGLAG